MEFLRSFLTALNAIRGVLSFWGFCAAATVILVAVLMRSPAIHKTWVAPVSRKLAPLHLFKLLKLLLYVLFTLSLVLIILAFSAPLLLEKIRLDARTHRLGPTLPPSEPSEVRELFGEALHVFEEEKEYETARRRFLILRKRVKSEEARDVVDGMVTASFYGMAKHREGIEYLCDIYSKYPKSDVRFRFEMHALIRRIAVREGLKVAEQVVNKFRPTCSRADLSYVWAGIPLAKAEYLRAGFTVFEDPYYLLPDDEHYLTYVTERYPLDAFLDHAYYFLGEFDQVISEFPESLILDVVYRAAGQKAAQAGEYEAAAKYLEIARARWPQRHIDSVVESLSSAYESLGDLRSLLRLRKQYRFSDDMPILVILGQQRAFINQEEVKAALQAMGEHGKLPSFPDLFQSNCKQYFAIASIEIEERRYSAALEVYDSTIRVFKEAGVEVPKCLYPIRLIVQKIKNVSEGGGSSQDVLNFGLYLRDHASQDTGLTGLRQAAVEVWVKCAGRFRFSPEAERALYLAAAAERRNNNYEAAARLFSRLATDYPKGKLVDDALTEVGWYHFVVRHKNYEARKYFKNVVQNYPNGNAADNAMNWLYLSYYETEEFREALEISRQIVKEYPLGRFAKLTAGRIERLEGIVASASEGATIKGLRLTEELSDAGLYVIEVEPESPASRAGFREGDIIEKLNGADVATLDGYYSALAMVPRGRFVSLQILRYHDTRQILRAVVGKDWFYSLPTS